MKIADISIIVATSNNLVIGKDNDLPWRLPSDLKYFKDTTRGKTVIMGRKCWESIPDKFRPLPNRTNVVLTRNHDYKADGAEVRHNLSLAIEEQIWGTDEVFVIGGSKIYEEAFQYASKVYITKVLHDVEGDVFLSGFNEDEWELESESDVMTENDMNYQFNIYNRKNVERK